VGDEETKKRKPMIPRSDVWEHFSKMKLDNGEDRAKCKYCGKQLCYDTVKWYVLHEGSFENLQEESSQTCSR
jgi:hypothetical protein